MSGHVPCGKWRNWSKWRKWRYFLAFSTAQHNLWDLVKIKGGKKRCLVMCLVASGETGQSGESGDIFWLFPQLSTIFGT
jgi:hypothetical protein